MEFPKKLLTRVSERVPGVHGKMGFERGWQKRLAKGWRKVGEGFCEGLAKGGQRVGKGLASFLAPSKIAISEAPVSKSGFVTRERKNTHTHTKKTHIKNFRGSQGGGPGGRFRGPNSLCSCHFSQQNTVHKEFQGGGSQGLGGGGVRSNFGGHLFMFMCFFGTWLTPWISRGRLGEKWTEVNGP